MRKSGVDCCYHYYQCSSLESTSIDKQLALVSWRLEINLLLLFVRVLGFGGGEPFRTNQISPFLVPLVFFSFSLAHSLTLMLCSRMSLVRACCVRGQRERETERQRQTELFFLFLCTQPKVGGRWGGKLTTTTTFWTRETTLRNKILRTKNNNKTRTPPTPSTRQKGENFLLLWEERSTYVGDDAKTFWTKKSSTNQKTKKQNDEKYLDALLKKEIYSPPLFERPQHTANGRNPRDDTLYARVASFVGDVLLRTTTPTFCFERRRRYPSEENNNGDSRVHRYAALLITRATQSRDFWFHRQRVTTRLLFSV